MSEYFKFKDDGTIEAVFDSKTYKFRRPKFGEYKTLFEALHDIDQQVTEAKIEALRGPGGPERKDPKKPTRAERLAEEVWLRDHNLATMERTDKHRFAYVEWIMGAFTALGPGSLEWPPHDEAPAWLESNAELFAGRMADHWRKIPLAPGENLLQNPAE